MRFGKECEVVLDEEFRDVRISDSRTAIVKVVFDEDWKIREVPDLMTYMFRRVDYPLIGTRFARAGTSA